MKKIAFKLICSSILIASLWSCEVLDQQPQNSVAQNTAFTNAAGAEAAVLGSYNALQSANYYGNRYLILPELHSGNLRHTGTFPSFAQFANRNLTTDNAEVTNMWAAIYTGINRANNVIEQVPGINDPALSEAQKNIYLGEARFLRAFHLFNALRYWGDVPIITKATKGADVTLQVPRNPISEVYTQIFADLDFAITNLPATASAGRATKRTAYALKARAHLYNNQWTEANTAAISAIGTGTLVSDYSSIFATKNSTEAIWEIQYDATNQSGMTFFLFPTANGGRNEVRPTTGLQAAYATNDTRRILTTSLDSKLKYFRISTQDDNVVIFRVGEMILTRAEALTELGGAANLQTAFDLVNQIRNRAGIGNAAGSLANDQVGLRNEIFLQRRLELALEGHYFFDLVRTGRAAVNLTSPAWVDTQKYLPIPLREINANPKLKQNDGY